MKISLQTTALKLKTTHQNPHQGLLRFRKRSQAKMKRRKQRKKKRKKREKSKRRKRRKNNSPLKSTSPKKRKTLNHPKITRRSPLRLIRRRQRKKREKRKRRKRRKRKKRKNTSPLKSINLKKRKTQNLLTNHQSLK